MLYINLAVWSVLGGLPLYGLRGGGGLLAFIWLFMALFGMALQALQPLFFAVAHGQASQAGFFQCVVYVLLCVAAFPLAKLANRFILINFDPFDWLLGLICGIGAAITFGHFFLGLLLIALTDSALLGEISHAFLVRQLVFYDAWHAIAFAMRNIEGRRPTY